MDWAKSPLSKASTWPVPILLAGLGGAALFYHQWLLGACLVVAGISHPFRGPTPPPPKLDPRYVAVFPISLLAAAIVLPLLAWLYVGPYVDGPLTNRIYTPTSSVSFVVALAGIVGLFSAGAAVWVSRNRGNVVGKHRGLLVAQYAGWIYLLLMGAYVVKEYVELYAKVHR